MPVYEDPNTPGLKLSFDSDPTDEDLDEAFKQARLEHNEEELKKGTKSFGGEVARDLARIPTEGLSGFSENLGYTAPFHMVKNNLENLPELTELPSLLPIPGNVGLMNRVLSGGDPAKQTFQNSATKALEAGKAIGRGDNLSATQALIESVPMVGSVYEDAKKWALNEGDPNAGGRLAALLADPLLPGAPTGPGRAGAKIAGKVADTGKLAAGHTLVAGGKAAQHPLLDARIAATVLGATGNMPGAAAALAGGAVIPPLGKKAVSTGTRMIDEVHAKQSNKAILEDETPARSAADFNRDRPSSVTPDEQTQAATIARLLEEDAAAARDTFPSSTLDDMDSAGLNETANLTPEELLEKERIAANLEADRTQAIDEGAAINHDPLEDMPVEGGTLTPEEALRAAEIAKNLERSNLEKQVSGKGKSKKVGANLEDLPDVFDGDGPVDPGAIFPSPKEPVKRAGRKKDNQTVKSVRPVEGSKSKFTVGEAQNYGMGMKSDLYPLLGPKGQIIEHFYDKADAEMAAKQMEANHPPTYNDDLGLTIDELHASADHGTTGFDLDSGALTRDNFDGPLPDDAFGVLLPDGTIKAFSLDNHHQAVNDALSRTDLKIYDLVDKGQHIPWVVMDMNGVPSISDRLRNDRLVPLTEAGPIFKELTDTLNNSIGYERFSVGIEEQAYSGSGGKFYSPDANSTSPLGNAIFKKTFEVPVIVDNVAAAAKLRDTDVSARLRNEDTVKSTKSDKLPDLEDLDTPERTALEDSIHSPGDNHLKIFSDTTLPINDRIKSLKRYAREIGVDENLAEYAGAVVSEFEQKLGVRFDIEDVFSGLEGVTPEAVNHFSKIERVRVLGTFMELAEKGFQPVFDYMKHNNWSIKGNAKIDSTPNASGTIDEVAGEVDYNKRELRIATFINDPSFRSVAFHEFGHVAMEIIMKRISEHLGGMNFGALKDSPDFIRGQNNKVASQALRGFADAGDEIGGVSDYAGTYYDDVAEGKGDPVNEFKAKGSGARVELPLTVNEDFAEMMRLTGGDPDKLLDLLSIGKDDPKIRKMRGLLLGDGSPRAWDRLGLSFSDLVGILKEPYLEKP